MEPIYVWSAVVALMAIVIVVKVMVSHLPNHRHMPFLSVGSEREEIFIPGDRIKIDEHDLDCYDED